jgi:hypothetical protein
MPRWLRLLAAWLGLAFTLAAGTFWQHNERTNQQIIVGGDFDDGLLSGFHSREQSDFLANMPFRWTRPEAQLRLWGLPQSVGKLALDLMVPIGPGTTQPVTITIGERLIGSLVVGSDMRHYQLLVPPSGPGDLFIGLHIPRLVHDDPRELGVVVTRIALTGIEDHPAALLPELALLPLLPLALALLGLAAVWTRTFSGVGWRADHWLVLPPAFILATLAGLGQALPSTGLLLASYVLYITLLLIGVLLGLTALQHYPQLRPNTDQRAQGWIVAAFAISVALTAIPSMEADGVGYYAYLRSLTIDGDLQFRNELEHYYGPLNVRPQRTGYIGNPWSVGPAIWWSPLYGITHLVMKTGQALGAPWQADGYDQHYLIMVTYTSSLAGLVAMLVCYRICRRWVEPPMATLTVISTVLGSNMLYYMTRHGSYAHALSACLASIYLLAWLRLEEQPSLRRWAAFGAAGGAMLLTYWVSGLALVLGALTFLRLLIQALRGPRERIASDVGRLVASAALALAICVVCFIPQMVVWQIIYGAPLVSPEGSKFITPGESHLLELLAGRPYGMLYWTPALLLGMFGLALLWLRARWQTIGLVLALGLYLWYNSTIPDWTGHGGLGYRRLSLLLPWCAIGLALIYDRLRRWHVILAPTLAIGMVSWVTFLTIRRDMGLIPASAKSQMLQPLLDLFISRNALPYWQIGPFIAESYLGTQIRMIHDLSSVASLALMLLIATISAWAVVRLFR